ncbi:MAG: LysR family transcriptional regulator [Shewanella psychromarinicola]|uniref:LysR family transcriptional regulator n=1 Tax=Shewanella psychromarinicola TaxID=2487742 RepID=UPI0030010136
MVAKADDIILFVMVVEAGSFTKVAEKLSLTNSVVSKHIARLEQDVNTQLLYRTTRKLALTDAGATFYGKARLAKIAFQEAADAISGYSDDVRGTIKLTIPVVPARLVLNNALADFCRDYPNVDVDLTIADQFVDILDQGYDLAIRTAHLVDSSLIARRLIDSDWLVCATPEYLKQNGTPLAPQHLAKHSCLLYHYESSGVDQWVFKNAEGNYTVNVQGRFRSNNLESLRQAALAHFGIAYLPQAHIYEDLQANNLVALLTEHSGKDLGIYAVYPSTRLPDKKIKLLIEYFRKAFHSKKDYFY